MQADQTGKEYLASQTGGSLFPVVRDMVPLLVPDLFVADIEGFTPVAFVEIPGKRPSRSRAR